MRHSDDDFPGRSPDDRSSAGDLLSRSNGDLLQIRGNRFGIAGMIIAPPMPSNARSAITSPADRATRAPNEATAKIANPTAASGMRR